MYDPTVFGIAVVGLIATIIALVFSLSIIPAQRAADYFSSSILRIYGADPVLLIVFIVLVAAMFLSALSAVDWFFGLANKWLFVAQFAFLGIAADSVRTFHRRTLKLLEPWYAASVLTKKVLRFIRNSDREARLMAWISSIQADSAKTADKEELRRAAMYSLRPELTSPINTWIEELCEMASKAIQRKEQRTVTAVINSIVAIAWRYAKIRSESDLPGPVGAVESVSMGRAGRRDDVGVLRLDLALAVLHHPA